MKGLTFIKGIEVTNLDVETKTVKLSDGRVISFDKCLIATGGTPLTRVPIENEAKPRVSTFRTINDFRKLYKLSCESKTIVVVGGGFLGCELANGIVHKASKVIHVYPEPGVLFRYLPRYLSDYTTTKLSQVGIDERPNTLVKNVKMQNGKVVLEMALQFRSPGKNEFLTYKSYEIEADHVVLAIGIEPNTKLAISAGLEIDTKNKGILVNSELQARSDIYAAGDVASFYDNILGRRRVEHHDHSIQSGRRAGQNMAGRSKPYTSQPMFWSDLKSTNIGYEAVGLVDSNLDKVGFWVMDKTKGTPSKDVPSYIMNDYVKGIVYYVKDNRVVGVLIWNLPGKIPQARKLIMEKKSVNQLNELRNAIDLESRKVDTILG